MEDKNKINRLLDELERQSELIAALRAEIATKDKRISELEAQLAATLAVIERSVFVEHDDRPADHIQMESRSLGSHYEYVEGCKP